jgi:serine/threonine-protein kinase
MGTVYQAVREADSSAVAVKVILPRVKVTPADVQRFLREAEVLRALTHPAIIEFHDVGEADGVLYIAMGYIEGTDASVLLQEQGPLPVGRAVRLTVRILEGLAHAHGKGFVHRDIKPGNILVARGPGEERAFLADFGLARVYQASPLSGLTVTGQLAGTPAFMPPEQVLSFRSVLPAGDQYSAAATLYTLLTGQFVFEAHKGVQEMLKLILQGTPVPIRSRRPEVPDDLSAVIHRALARDAGHRFPDVAAFRTALLPFAGVGAATPGIARTGLT